MATSKKVRYYSAERILLALKRAKKPNTPLNESALRAELELGDE